MSQRTPKREAPSTGSGHEVLYGRKREALESDDRRGWLSHGLAALAISALGLAVAGSVALTTSAQSAGPVSPDARTSMVRQSDSTLAVPAQQEWAGPQTGGRTVGSTADAESGTLVFTRSGDADPSRARIRTARVAEQAAQRQATLVRAQQSVALRAAQASDQARRTQLAETEKQTQANELRLIEEKRRQAEEARKAAEAAAQQASEPNGNGGATGTAASDQQNQQPTPTSPQIDAGAISTGRGVSPVAGAVVGAQFGQWGSWSRWHTGLDFRASYGTPIRAVQNGIVVFAGNSGDWAGNHVAIRHAGGVTSMSSHMSRMAVSSGQSVQAGQIIGYVGETGRAFGAHLHFELYPAGVRYGDVYRAINPLPWLASNGVQTR